MTFKIENEEQIKTVLGNAEIERKKHISNLSTYGLTDEQIAWVLVRIGKSYLLTKNGVNMIRNNDRN